MTDRSLRVGLDARLVPVGLGIATFVTELARALAPLVDVVWFGPASAAPASVQEVHELSGWPYPLLDHAPGRHLVRRSSVDCMHFTGNTGWVRPGPVPYVLTVHDLVFLDTGLRGVRPRQAIGRRYARLNVHRAVRRAAAVATVSEVTADEVTRRLRTPIRPVVIPHGISVPPAIASSRESGQPYVVAFSGSDARKGVLLALAAWRLLGDDPPRLRVLAGAGVPPGFMEDTDEDRRAGRVEVLSYLEREEVLAILGGAQALLYPSSAEGFGFPVLEAMALGVPVITGLSPATREVGGNAVLLIDESQPVASMATSLERVREGGTTIDDLRRQGRLRAEAHSWRAAAESYAHLYARASGRPLKQSLGEEPLRGRGGGHRVAEDLNHADPEY